MLVFPGQGSQRVGMGADLAQHSAAARHIFNRLDAIAGRPISRLCFDGPEDALRPTDVAQPALVATALAALAAYRELAGDPIATLDVRWLAGHSLGEYAACVAAGALSLDDGLSLAVERGRLMASAPPGAMTAVLGLDTERLTELCQADRGTVVVANDNAPGQAVLSGEPESVARVGQAAQAAGARRVIPLNVGGAFHSPLMADAARAFDVTLAATPIKDPIVPIVGNVEARPLATATELRTELAAQIASPVRWRESVLWLADVGADRLIECGPGNVLSGLAKRTAATVSSATLGTWDEVAAIAAR